MNIIIRIMYFTCLLMTLAPPVASQGQRLAREEVSRHHIRRIEARHYHVEGKERELTAIDRFEYDTDGQLVHRQRMDAEGHLQIAVEAAYDPFQHQSYHRLHVAEQEINTEVQWDLRYQDGRLTTEHEDELGLLRHYSYDEAGRISKLAVSFGGELPPFSVEYFSYDAAGRLVRHLEKAELLETATTYRYDRQGRVIRVAEHKRYHVEDRPDGFRSESYRYNAAGLLVRLTRQAGPDATPVHIHYRYDAQGQLIEKRCQKQRITYERNEKGLILTQRRFRADRLIAQKTFTYQCWDGSYVAEH
jgi:hypothetical protein